MSAGSINRFNSFLSGSAVSFFVGGEICDLFFFFSANHPATLAFM